MLLLPLKVLDNCAGFADDTVHNLLNGWDVVDQADYLTYGKQGIAYVPGAVSISNVFTAYQGKYLFNRGALFLHFKYLLGELCFNYPFCVVDGLMYEHRVSFTELK